ncbi:hypothetical protein BDD12DRAFT_896682 [Trichophaea hybrida]|nr:hypothetical protein BDD12DRAFT_896682 [Trichophaea hybrida]
MTSRQTGDHIRDRERTSRPLRLSFLSAPSVVYVRFAIISNKLRQAFAFRQSSVARLDRRKSVLSFPGVATLGQRKAIVATLRSFEQFLLEGSAYIVTKFQRDGKQGFFLNTNLEHGSKHRINYPDQKVATKAIAIALERLYIQDLPREKSAELLEAYRGWFGLVSYPDLPGNAPNNNQFNFDAPRFTETSTPEPEEEEEVIPEPPLINTAEESFETAPFTTPRLRAKPTAPDRRIITSDLQVEYNNDQEA